MNSFVTDNQMKQKAHDRYYYAIAKRDFIQGRKLKALIDKESLDDASTEQLAQLYQKVTPKSREYDYDSVSGRLSRKKPAPIKGEQKYNTEKTKEPTEETSPKKASPQKQKKNTYIPESTDPETTASDIAQKSLKH
ncbi:unnamed protein product [Phytophthora fragariaefolia]|uniref:Unnamed protein product n=1 Tax=Phytophthora fragariaefolia TaxID=1490495 RepID=A0A9W7D5P8_9STRA|nr:unnamed protein product [Phytophthora fragariaefolia]